MPEVEFNDAAALAQLARLLVPPVEEFIEIKGKKYRTTSAKKVGTVNGKLKVIIKSNEHPPPHFHVEYQNDSASFRISDCMRIAGDLEQHDKVLRGWFLEHKAELIKIWDDTRPANCPVGKYKEQEPQKPPSPEGGQRSR